MKLLFQVFVSLQSGVVEGGGGVLGKFYLLSRYVLLSILTFNMTVFLRRPIFETPL